MNNSSGKEFGESLCIRCKGTGKEPYWKPKREDRNNRINHGWACPKCRQRHYDVTANVCPSCGLDFNSQEFKEICKTL